jgi:hypothetical protein
MSTTEINIVVVISIYLIGLGFTHAFIKQNDENYSWFIKLLAFVTSPVLILITIGHMICNSHLKSK